MFRVSDCVLLGMNKAMERNRKQRQKRPWRGIENKNKKELDVLETSVDVVGDVSAVHDLAEDVAHIQPWRHRVVLEVIEEHVDTVDEVTLVEGIVDVPSDWPELSPLNEHSMVVPAARPRGEVV